MIDFIIGIGILLVIMAGYNIYVSDKLDKMERIIEDLLDGVDQ
jgi:Tfp pilus assembly protein PilO